MLIVNVRCLHFAAIGHNLSSGPPPHVKSEKQKGHETTRGAYLKKQEKKPEKARSERRGDRSWMEETDAPLKIRA